jgi:hypothetical protein
MIDAHCVDLICCGARPLLADCKTACEEFLEGRNSNSCFLFAAKQQLANSCSKKGRNWKRQELGKTAGIGK